jgi:hypothetical protein
MESDNEAMASDNEAMDWSVAEEVADRSVAEFEDFQSSCRSVAEPSDYVKGDFQRMFAAMSSHEQAAIKYAQVDCVEEARLEKEAFKAKKEATAAERQRRDVAAAERQRREAAAAAERQRRDVALQHEAAARDAEAAIEEAQTAALAARERRAVAVLNRGRGGVPWRQDQEGGWADNEQHRDQEAQRARADNRRGRAKGSAWRSV